MEGRKGGAASGRSQRLPQAHTVAMVLCAFCTPSTFLHPSTFLRPGFLQSLPAPSVSSRSRGGDMGIWQPLESQRIFISSSDPLAYPSAEGSGLVPGLHLLALAVCLTPC